MQEQTAKLRSEVQKLCHAKMYKALTEILKEEGANVFAEAKRNTVSAAYFLESAMDH